MSGYVEKAAVLRIIFDSVGKPATEIYQKVRELPEADVVLCSDCRCFQCNIRQDGKGNLVVPEGVPKFECRWWCAEVNPKDYCSYAKRKEGGETDGTAQA